MKLIAVILFVALSGIAFGQNVTNQFGGQPSFAGQLISAVPSAAAIPYPLLLDLNPDLGVFSDAGTTPATNTGIIIQWNDQSGNGYNFSGGTTLETNIANGHSVVRFLASALGGGTGNSMANTTLVHPCPLVVFLVMATSSSDWSLGETIYSSPISSSTPSLGGADFGYGTPHLNAMSAGNPGLIPATAFPTSGFNLITISWAVSSINIRLNGIDIGSSSGGTSVGFNGLVINPSFLSYCDIARFAISTNASLSSVTNIENVLMTNYITGSVSLNYLLDPNGLTIFDPAGNPIISL
jgi:hypothetical protein